MARPPEKQDRLREIMELSLDAVRSHHVMAGHSIVPESYIRDWVAINLFNQYKEHGLSISLETLRADFRKFCVTEAQRPAFDLLVLKNLKIDMIIWDADRPQMIVELKRDTRLEDDAKRTAALLSVVGADGVEGYLVTAIVNPNRETVVRYTPTIERVTCQYRDGDV